MTHYELGAGRQGADAHTTGRMPGSIIMLSRVWLTALGLVSGCREWASGYARLGMRP